MSTQVGQTHHLEIMLDASVPLKLIQIQERGGPNEEDWQQLREFQRMQLEVPDAGEALLYKVGKKGLSAQMFNLLTHTIAVLAFQPGGIDIFGRHWDGSKPIL